MIVSSLVDWYTGICGLPCSVLSGDTKERGYFPISKRLQGICEDNEQPVATAKAFSGNHNTFASLKFIKPLYVLLQTHRHPCPFFLCLSRSAIRRSYELWQYCNFTQIDYRLNRIYCHWDLPHARFLSIRCIAAIGKWHVKWDFR